MMIDDHDDSDGDMTCLARRVQKHMSNKGNMEMQATGISPATPSNSLLKVSTLLQANIIRLMMMVRIMILMVLQCCSYVQDKGIRPCLRGCYH